MATLNKRKLGNTDVELTSLGLGTSHLGGPGVAVPFEQFEAVVLEAIIWEFATSIRRHFTA